MALTVTKNVRWGALVALFLATAVAGPLMLLRSPKDQIPPSKVVSEQGKSPLQSLAELLGLRSPGERSKGILLASKQRLDTRGGEGSRRPYERALGKIVNPALTPAPASPEKDVSPLDQAAVPALAGPFETSALVPAAAAAPGFGSPVGTILTQPAGLPSLGTTTPVTPVPPVLTAVPEPATWLLMLLTFLPIGLALRRNHRLLASAATLLPPDHRGGRLTD